MTKSQCPIKPQAPITKFWDSSFSKTFVFETIENWDSCPPKFCKAKLVAGEIGHWSLEFGI
ncbi:MAG: hypothetical protein COT33_01185 [Candidatus Nealsonbacteria bacterium CG08_land_8_20_14_0_20_38_20]|uniref:Uncharacterized protein n=1 Tax=Candidatus Nealsonbacteria bacterium CG08_land_8_20_14_0_20_38_20 TaxID=1974705 RepID=A0A2H0YM72_9BACT|nr:MAG: hypothetical protein COT33_01185 [Candidatus Nealsonbacteria bacterium CG08_land_8_20_14_0_20_38_20]